MFWFILIYGQIPGNTNASKCFWQGIQMSRFVITILKTPTLSLLKLQSAAFSQSGFCVWGCSSSTRYERPIATWFKSHKNSNLKDRPRTIGFSLVYLKVKFGLASSQAHIYFCMASTVLESSQGLRATALLSHLPFRAS